MSQFNQPMIGAAPPFIGVNPGGVDPSQAIEVLARVQQGALERANQRALQQNEINYRRQEEEKERAFRGEQFGLDRQSQMEQAQLAESGANARSQAQIAAQERQIQAAREDQRFERERTERLAAEDLRLQSELESLDEAEDNATRESAAAMVARIRERRKEILERKEDLQRQKTRLSALMTAKTALLGGGDPQLLGRLFSHVEDAIAAKTTVMDAMGVRLDTAFDSLDAMFTGQDKRKFLPLDKDVKRPGGSGAGRRTDDGTLRFEAYKTDPTFLNMGGSTVPEVEMHSPLQPVADAIAEATGAQGPEARFLIDNMLRTLVRARAGEAGAEQAAAGMYEQLIKPREEGGAGLDNERLSMAIRMAAERALGREEAVGRASAERELSGQEVPKKSRKDSQGVRSSLRMIGEGLSAFERLRGSDGRVLAVPPTSELPEETIRGALLDAVMVVSNSSDLPDLYRRLSDDDPTNDQEVEGALGASVLAKLPPATRAAMRKTIAQQLGALLEGQEYRSLRGDLPGGKLTVAEEDALSDMLSQAERDVGGIQEEEERASAERITGIRGKYQAERSRARQRSLARRGMKEK